VDMCVGVLEVLSVEADRSFGIISVRYLTHQLAIDAKQEIGTLSIHAQEVIHIQPLDALLNSFCEGYKPTGRAFEHLPLLGSRRDGEGIVLVTGTTENQTITIITLGCGSSSNSLNL